MEGSEILSAHGLLNTGFLDEFLATRITHDLNDRHLDLCLPDWLRDEEIAEGPGIDPGGIFGFWVLGQFGHGIQIGVLADRKGELDGKFHMMGGDRTLCGSLVVGGDEGLLEEGELEDRFGGYDDDGPLSVFSVRSGDALEDVIRPLFFNKCRLEEREGAAETYLLRIQAGLKKLDFPAMVENDVLSSEFWGDLEKIYCDLGLVGTGSYLTVLENYLLLAASTEGGEGRCLAAFQKLVDAAKSCESPWFHRYLSRVEMRMKW